MCLLYNSIIQQNKFRFSYKFNLLAIAIKLDVSFFPIFIVLEISEISKYN